ncbi:polyketide cyclase [Lacrimispora sp.]|uniref:polyketide cyclase n=1 Tax=Lacrimispora sp. TaxID=2719234 RepID=UPI0032E4A5C4
MAVSNIRVSFQCNVQWVWDTVTSLENYLWRSDISKIETLNENQFVEYTKNGYTTTFINIVTEPLRRWEFDMENTNIKGHWTGLFSQEGNVTIIDFTENITAKKLLLKPFIKTYLKKHQLTYVADLKKALLQ